LIKRYEKFIKKLAWTSVEVFSYVVLVFCAVIMFSCYVLVNKDEYIQKLNRRAVYECSMNMLMTVHNCCTQLLIY